MGAPPSLCAGDSQRRTCTVIWESCSSDCTHLLRVCVTGSTHTDDRHVSSRASCRAAESCSAWSRDQLRKSDHGTQRSGHPHGHGLPMQHALGMTRSQRGTFCLMASTAWIGGFDGECTLLRPCGGLATSTTLPRWFESAASAAVLGAMRSPCPSGRLAALIDQPLPAASLAGSSSAALR